MSFSDANNFSFLDVNFLAVIVVAIINIILAMLWYSPKVFGTLWAKEHGFDMSSLHVTPWHYLGAIIVALVTSYVFALFVTWFDIGTTGYGLLLGFLFWLGFIATTHFSGVLWAKKPIKAYLIDAGFQLVSMLIMGAILANWA